MMHAVSLMSNLSEHAVSHADLGTSFAFVKSADRPKVDPRTEPEPGKLKTLPEWPITTVAMLSTMDDRPYAIPVTSPLRVGDRQILFVLKQSRGSLARLRKYPEVALSILCEGDLAFTARGIATVVQDPMVRAPGFAAVAIDVEEIENHRQRGRFVGSGVGLDWGSDDMVRFLPEHVDALREIAAGEARLGSGRRSSAYRPTLNHCPRPHSGECQGSSLTDDQSRQHEHRVNGERTMTDATHYDRSRGKGRMEPIRGERGGTILGPRNVAVESENPDMLASPYTDAGTIPNLKFSYATARNRLGTGGWAREVTARELPIATTLAGVNMRLNPGGIREMHWHKEAEWAYMLAGRARLTAIDPQGRNFIDDVGPGDLWNFPAGIPHSIQGLEEGCEFLLVFDDGNFSENETFTISDWFAHTPRDVLAQNLGVTEAAFSNLPSDLEHTRWVFAGEVPGLLASDVVKSPAGTVPFPYSHRLLAQQPLKVAGGQVRIVDSSNFPAASTIAAALVEIEPGGLRELHWHPNNDEWQYYISGSGRMTVFASSGKARTFDYQAGDVGYVPFAMGHYVQNTGDEPLRFLEMFRSPYFADISVNQWMALTPPELVQAHLNLDPKIIAALSKDKAVILP